MEPMKDGQCVEGLFCRGGADECVVETVLDAREMKVEFDKPPPNARPPEDD